MYTKLFSSVFSLSLEDFEDELSYQYSKEEKSLTTEKTASKKKADRSGSGKQDLLTFASDIESVLTWKVSDDSFFNESGILGNNRLDLDKYIRRLDMKIAQLEREERLEKEEENNSAIMECDDTEKELLRFANIFRPQPGFSDYYILLYHIAVLNKCCSRLESTSKVNLSKATQILSSHSSFPPEANFVLNILRFINDCNRDAKFDSKKGINSSASEYVNRICGKAFSKDNWEELDTKHLLLSIQLVALVKVLMDSSIQRESAFQFTLAMISLKCAGICLRNKDYENGIRFSFKSLMVDNAADRQFAFNVLGLCAIENQQYQLAYDAYCSWINMRMVGYLKPDRSINDHIVKGLEDVLNGTNEIEWRKRETKAVAVMYGNYAYVCGTMYDLIERSVQREQLKGLAKHFIKLAIECNPESASFYCSAGTIHYDAKMNEDAIEYYMQFYNKARELEDKVTALRSILQLYQEMQNTSSNIDFEAIEADFVNKYQQLSSEGDVIENHEIIEARDLYVLFSECALLSDELKKVKYILLKIDNEIRCILNILKRTWNAPPTFNLHLELFKQTSELLAEIDTIAIKKNTKRQKGEQQRPKEIAYYTTLKNLQFLLAEKLQENGNTINCLTMMHARYMNDPDEGLILLQKLQDYLPKAPEIMRNELYDQKFVFLKSFTGLVDQLNMWTMYGSDRDTGSDCNGCCVCIAPETFSMVSNKQNRQTNKLSFYEDDYHLYSVAYIEGEKIFVDGERSRTIEKHYNRLKKLLANISKVLVSASSTDTNIISTCLVRMLEKAMFLFKDKSYHLEAESRLILTRDVKDKSEIKKTPQEPPKLFINPMIQVFPEKIVLGPKVENPDNWIPHLQYELSKICENWPPDSTRIYKPIVRKSRINIR